MMKILLTVDRIHNTAVMYEGEEEDFIDDGEGEDLLWDVEEEEVDPLGTPKRETLKSLRKRARDMERRCEL
jgi:hypothetical protein